MSACSDSKSYCKAIWVADKILVILSDTDMMMNICHTCFGAQSENRKSAIVSYPVTLAQVTLQHANFCKEDTTCPNGLQSLGYCCKNS